MVKKRKIKKEKAAKVAAAIAPFGAAYTLSLAGGIVILVAGILAILGLRWGMPVALVTVDMAVELFSGIAILLATASIRKKPRVAGIIILAFSLVTLAMLAFGGIGGLVFGPVLSLIGAILLLMRR